MDKYKKKEKELRAIRTELDTLDRFRSWGRKDRFVIEWKTLDTKEFLGWEICPNIKPGYHPHEEVVNHILEHLSEPYMINDPSLVNKMRAVKHSVAKVRVFIYKHFKRSWIQTEHPMACILPKTKIPKYVYDTMVKDCPIELRATLRLFFRMEMEKTYRWRGEGDAKVPYYYLKFSNDTSSSYEFPIQLVYYTFHKTYVTEIGLIDGDYIAKYEELNHKGYRDYEYVSAWGSQHYRRWMDNGEKEKSRSSYRNFSKNLLKLDNIDEDTVFEEATKHKFYRRPNKVYKWSF